MSPADLLRMFRADPSPAKMQACTDAFEAAFPVRLLMLPSAWFTGGSVYHTLHQLPGQPNDVDIFCEEDDFLGMYLIIERAGYTKIPANGWDSRYRELDAKIVVKFSHPTLPPLDLVVVTSVMQTVGSFDLSCCQCMYRPGYLYVPLHVEDGQTTFMPEDRNWEVAAARLAKYQARGVVVIEDALARFTLG
jgi:hypothetical protein